MKEFRRKYREVLLEYTKLSCRWLEFAIDRSRGIALETFGQKYAGEVGVGRRVETTNTYYHRSHDITWGHPIIGS